MLRVPAAVCSELPDVRRHGHLYALY